MHISFVIIAVKEGTPEPPRYYAVEKLENGTMACWVRDLHFAEFFDSVEKAKEVIADPVFSEEVAGEDGVIFPSKILHWASEVCFGTPRRNVAIKIMPITLGPEAFSVEYDVRIKRPEQEGASDQQSQAAAPSPTKAATKETATKKQSAPAKTHPVEEEFQFEYEE